MVEQFWNPKIGQEVWLNRPDANDSLGKVIGYVSEGGRHEGQPIIEAMRDKNSQFSPVKKGDKSIIHPAFLLPFPFGGDRWEKANEEGLINA